MRNARASRYDNGTTNRYGFVQYVPFSFVNFPDWPPLIDGFSGENNLHGFLSSIGLRENTTNASPVYINAPDWLQATLVTQNAQASPVLTGNIYLRLEAIFDLGTSTSSGMPPAHYLMDYDEDGNGFVDFRVIFRLEGAKGDIYFDAPWRIYYELPNRPTIVWPTVNGQPPVAFPAYMGVPWGLKLDEDILAQLNGSSAPNFVPSAGYPFGVLITAIPATNPETGLSNDDIYWGYRGIRPDWLYVSVVEIDDEYALLLHGIPSGFNPILLPLRVNFEIFAAHDENDIPGQLLPLAAETPPYDSGWIDFNILRLPAPTITPPTGGASIFVRAFGLAENDVCIEQRLFNNFLRNVFTDAHIYCDDELDEYAYGCFYDWVWEIDVPAGVQNQLNITLPEENRLGTFYGGHFGQEFNIVANAAGTFTIRARAVARILEETAPNDSDVRAVSPPSAWITFTFFLF
jgi:hypothetical protein